MKYLRFPDLLERGIVRNRVTLGRWIKAGRFPAPVQLGPNSVGWPEAEVEAFEQRLIAERDAAGAPVA